MNDKEELQQAIIGFVLIFLISLLVFHLNYLQTC